MNPLLRKENRDFFPINEKQGKKWAQKTDIKFSNFTKSSSSESLEQINFEKRFPAGKFALLSHCRMRWKKGCWLKYWNQFKESRCWKRSQRLRDCSCCVADNGHHVHKWIRILLQIFAGFTPTIAQKRMSACLKLRLKYLIKDTFISL